MKTKEVNALNLSVGDVLVMGSRNERIVIKGMRERRTLIELDVEGDGFTSMTMSLAATVRVEVRDDG